MKCLLLIPGSFIMCGEGANYCSTECRVKARANNPESSNGKTSDFESDYESSILSSGSMEVINDQDSTHI